MKLDIRVPVLTRKNILKFKGRDESAVVSRKVTSVDDFEKFKRVDAYINDMVALLFKNQDSLFNPSPMKREFEDHLREELERVIGENFNFDPIRVYEVRIPIIEPES